MFFSPLMIFQYFKKVECPFSTCLPLYTKEGRKQILTKNFSVNPKRFENITQAALEFIFNGYKMISING